MAEVSAPQRPIVRSPEQVKPVEKTKTAERPPERVAEEKPPSPPPKPSPYVNTRGETTGQRINTTA